MGQTFGRGHFESLEMGQTLGRGHFEGLEMGQTFGRSHFEGLEMGQTLGKGRFSAEDMGLHKEDRSPYWWMGDEPKKPCRTKRLSQPPSPGRTRYALSVTFTLCASAGGA